MGRGIGRHDDDDDDALLTRLEENIRNRAGNPGAPLNPIVPGCNPGFGGRVVINRIYIYK